MHGQVKEWEKMPKCENAWKRRQLYKKFRENGVWLSVIRKIPPTNQEIALNNQLVHRAKVRSKFLSSSFTTSSSQSGDSRVRSKIVCSESLRSLRDSKERHLRQHQYDQLPWLISETIHFYPPIHQDPMVESLVILTMIISCKLST